MTDPRAYLADVLADLAPSTGITGEGGPYHAVQSESHPWIHSVENSVGELACEGDSHTQAEQLARLLNASPAMARALVAVLELTDPDGRIGGERLVPARDILAAITTELTKEIERG